MQDAILMAKVLEGNAKKQLVVNTPDAKITQVCSTTNILLKYNWHLNLMDNEVAVYLGLQSNKKYWRLAVHVVDKLGHL